MKFCFSVCEYDPLHNGHIYHINQMDKTGCDAKAIIMSGNFTQRGGIATLDKYTRAVHAIRAGADVVIELPTVFSTAPAEIFAKGAIKLLSLLGDKNTLCFGTECGDSDDFWNLARATMKESKAFKEILKKYLDQGQPYARALSIALKETTPDINTDILDNPNSILGLEYSKAILSKNVDMNIYPILRQGTGFKDKTVKQDFCSASLIREKIATGEVKKLKKCMPDYVYKSLPEKLPDINQIAIYSLLLQPTKKLAEILDCSEGLENRLKVISKTTTDFEELVSKLKTKRYTATRLRRIAIASLLGIDKDMVEKCLKTDLYIKILAIKKSRMDILTELSNALVGKKTKLVTRKSDCDNLSGTALECFEKDAFSNNIYSLVTGEKINDYEMKIVEC